jgi:hypothetical protein
VIGAAVAVPVNACGIQGDIIAYKNVLESQNCSIG